MFSYKCGLLLGLVRAQHVHYESKCERKSWGLHLAFHYESENIICNRLRADGVSCPFGLGKSKFGLSKWGAWPLGPTGANQAQEKQGPFGAISALPPVAVR